MDFSVVVPEMDPVGRYDANNKIANENIVGSMVVLVVDDFSIEDDTLFIVNLN